MGIFTLAHYQALPPVVDDKAYATTLATDFCWRGYEQSIGPSRLLARLVTRDPQKQMNLMMRMGLRYPFSRPDYDWKVHPDPDAFSVDFYRCPVFDYFKTQGEEAVEFFRNSWCTLEPLFSRSLREKPFAVSSETFHLSPPVHHVMETISEDPAVQTRPRSLRVDLCMTGTRFGVSSLRTQPLYTGRILPGYSRLRNQRT